MRYEFRWNAWNVEHIAKHGISTDEAEEVVMAARPPYPEEVARGEYLAMGQTPTGECLQVLYVFDPPGVVYVIHARPLRDHEKRRFRRRSRS